MADEQQPVVPTVRIEGVGFELDDARELAERARLETTGPSSPRLTAWVSLAAQIEQRVDEGGGDLLPLNENERTAVLAVLDEWRRGRATRPSAVDELYFLLAPAPQ